MPCFGVLVEGTGIEIPVDDGTTARGFLVWRYVEAESQGAAIRTVVAELETTPRLELARSAMHLKIDSVIQFDELPDQQPGFIFYEEES